MHPVETYLTSLHCSLGAGTPETSGYPALSNLLNAIGDSLKPKITAAIEQLEAWWLTRLPLTTGVVLAGGRTLEKLLKSFKGDIIDLDAIVENCRRLGINPKQYLTDVLTRLPGMKASGAASLTPANWLKARSGKPEPMAA